MVFGGTAGLRTSARRRRGTPRQISVPRPTPRDPLGNSLLSPIGGASLLVIIICTPAGGAFVKKFVITSGGVSLIIDLISTARRRGVPFTRVKGTKTRLGRCPKTPVAGCAGYGLIFDGSPKSIRTAHRYAPKVATGVSALSPHPLSRWRERGSDGRASAGRQFSARGVRVCKNRKPPTLKYLFPAP